MTDVKFSLATANIAGRAVPLMEVGGRHWTIGQRDSVPATRNLPATMIEVFEQWEASFPLLSIAANLLADPGPAMRGQIIANPGFLAPLLYPRKLIMMGTNYLDHVRGDAGFTDFDKSANIPTLFMKPPSTAIVGPGVIPYPRQTEKFDWEVELAVVIGRRATSVSAEQAVECIAAYGVGIDLSARDWQFHPKHLVKFDLFGGKAFDASNPLGHSLVPASFVDFEQMELTLAVNGDLKQHGSVGQMIWSVPEIISAITEHVTLEPGDMIMTGTPSGVGLSSNTYLKPGDHVNAQISGLGTLEVVIGEAEQS
jgi:2-keto-4-pentenoate hydratase/2-oxohepta-3-ene-1,7-dioic acid hydratase in catechol pathway